MSDILTFIFSAFVVSLLVLHVLFTAWAINYLLDMRSAGDAGNAGNAGNVENNHD